MVVFSRSRAGCVIASSVVGVSERAWHGTPGTEQSGARSAPLHRALGDAELLTPGTDVTDHR
ncbi:hypothetical protein GCM10010255_44980 [Streptomyces coeruleofuscus]|uniref:Uncharacterized protein n=1 Tax=Streptomyces coeruleofuscus TaxID=66879 RepID=A0ABP5VK61_9ACTN